MILFVGKRIKLTEIITLYQLSVSEIKTVEQNFDHVKWRSQIQCGANIVRIHT